MLKKLVFLVAIAAGGWFGYQYYQQTQALPDDQVRNYLPNIIRVSAEQVEFLSLSGKRNEKPTLLFVFETDSLLSRWHYSVVETFAKQYARSQLNILMLSIDSSDMALARFLLSTPPPVRPLMLKPGQKDALFRVLRKLGSNYDGSVPHFAVINKAGFFEDITPGLSIENKLNGLITRSLDVSG